MNNLIKVFVALGIFLLIHISSYGFLGKKKIDFISGYFETKSPTVRQQKRDKISSSACKIEDCFHYSSCENGVKTRIHIFEFDYITSTILKSVDLAELERFSIELVKSFEDQSCFTFIFMHDEKDREYAVKIANYLKNPATSKTNIVFVDVNSNITSIAFSNVEAINRYFSPPGIISSDNFDETLKDTISRSSVASFNNVRTLSSLFFHFSMYSNDKLPSANIRNSSLLIHRPRKHLLSFFASVSSNPRSSLLEKLQGSHQDIRINLECDSACLTSQDTLLDMIDSTFTVILPDSSSSRWTAYNTERLITALKFQVIPVVLDADLRLPLSDLIVWDEFVVRLPQFQSGNLVAIISDMSNADIVNRQLKARNIFTSYFRSPTAQLQTLIAGLLHFYHIVPPSLKEIKTKEFQMIPSQLNAPLAENQTKKEQVANKIDDEDQDKESILRVKNMSKNAVPGNPKPSKSFKYKAGFLRTSFHSWNRLHYPFNHFAFTPFHPTFTKEQFSDDKFTLVILSYKRVETLAKQLEAYVNLPYLNQIIVIWNDLATILPSSLMLKFALYFSTKKIRIIKSSKSSLNNRFLPYDLIETDAVLSLDNDILLRADEIIFAFRVWRENRDRVVGFPAKLHVWSSNSSSFIYQPVLSCEYSMVLTGAAFYHRFYNFMYSYIMDARIREHTNAIKNCEDIAFNMMVSHQTRKPPLKVTSKWDFQCAECDEPSGPSLNPHSKSVPLSFRKDHYIERSKCVQLFTSIYGYNPLISSQYRADSVLFQIPNVENTCYESV